MLLEISARGTGKSTRLIKSLMLILAEDLMTGNERKLICISPNSNIAKFNRELLMQQIPNNVGDFKEVEKNKVEFISWDYFYRAYINMEIRGINIDLTSNRYFLDEFDFFNIKERLSEHILDNIVYAVTTPGKYRRITDICLYKDGQTYDILLHFLEKTNGAYFRTSVFGNMGWGKFYDTMMEVKNFVSPDIWKMEYMGRFMEF